MRVGESVQFDYSGPEGTTVLRNDNGAFRMVAGEVLKCFNNTKRYAGRIENIRNIETNPLCWQTADSYICDRSPNLLTVETSDGFKSFYDGRIFNMTKVGFWGTILERVKNLFAG